MDMFHMPHGYTFGYLSHKAWNRFVGERLRACANRRVAYVSIASKQAV
jgi:hypothetical protein